MCKTPRKRFAEIDKPPDPVLTSNMYQTCMKSKHPSIYICPKEPDTSDARKLHRVVKKEVKKLERREKRKERKKRKRRGNKKRNKKRKLRSRKRTKCKNGRCKNRKKKGKKGQRKKASNDAKVASRHV